VYIIWILLGIVLLFCVLFFCFAYFLSGGNYQGPVSDHFNGKRFQNPSGVNAKGFKDVAKFIKTRELDKWNNNFNAYVRNEKLPETNPKNFQFLFVNHSSFLLQHQGLNILTDPIWSKRCSPFQFAGPARYRPPGLGFDYLPNIDVVLISHNHYDHLDKNTIKKLNQKHNPVYLVPLGVDKIMKKWGCKKVVALDWWETYAMGSLNFMATPANHFSSRGTFDRNTTLWCGYILRSVFKTIYYVGDTGYGKNFKNFKDKVGSIDITFIPIGAFKPEWFMGPIHVSPEEAIKLHFEIDSKQSVAMHFGTFPLADDNPERAIKRLNAAMDKNMLTKEDFLIPQEGIVYNL